ncbi:uncharacterized protein METZ01_LOCUS245013, partial [marine metagenome]
VVLPSQRRPVQRRGAGRVPLIHRNPGRKTCSHPLAIAQPGRLKNIVRLNAAGEQPKG